MSPDTNHQRSRKTHQVKLQKEFCTGQCYISAWTTKPTIHNCGVCTGIYADTNNTGKHTCRLCWFFFFGTVFVKHNHRRTHTHRSPVVQTQTDRIDDWGRRMKVWKWVGRETCNVRGVSTTHSPAMYVPSPLSASSCEQYTLAHRSCHQISKNHIKPWLSGWCVAAVNGAHWSRGVAKCVRASV